MTSTPHKNKNGNIEWRNEKGLLHRENGPAITFPSGQREWWLNEQLHRENGPAVEWVNGTKEWWVNGQLHRENGPALESVNGAKEWYLHGRRHRENGPAVEWVNGTKEWWVNGKTGPEIEQKVKENMALIQQQELIDVLSQDQEISDKIKTSSPKISKKL